MKEDLYSHINKSRHKAFILLILIAQLVFENSCIPAPQTKPKDCESIDISSKNTHASKTQLSQIASDIDYTILETNRECFIGQISKWKITANYIFIADNSQKSVFMFNWDGSFIREIGRSGHGPGEHTEIVDIDFDEKNGHIFIGSTDGKINIYNEKGDFIDYINHFTYVYSFRHVDARFITFYPFPINKMVNDFEIIVYDENGEVYKSLAKKYTKLGSNTAPMLNPLMYSIGNHVCFWEEYNDTVFQVDSDFHVTPRFHFEYESRKETSQKITQVVTDNEYWTKGLNISNFVETPNYIFIKSVLDGYFNHLIYFRQSGVSEQIGMVSKYFGVSNNIDGGFPFWPSVYSDDRLHMLCSASRILDYWNSNYYKRSSKNDLDRNFESLIQAIDYNSNPIIISLSLRDMEKAQK